MSLKQNRRFQTPGSYEVHTERIQTSNGERPDHINLRLRNQDPSQEMQTVYRLRGRWACGIRNETLIRSTTKSRRRADQDTLRTWSMSPLKNLVKRSECTSSGEMPRDSAMTGEWITRLGSGRGSGRTST